MVWQETRIANTAMDSDIYGEISHLKTLTLGKWSSVFAENPKSKTNQEENWYDPYGPNDMVLYKEYYWKIVTRDKSGLETEGPDWSFITGINHKPTAPEVNGPSNGDPGVEYTFTFVSTDEDNHTINYIVDWDDGNTDETGFYESGEIASLSHIWKEGESC